MKAKEWQNYGYKIFFLDGFVYLYRPNLEAGYVTEIDGGRWISYQNPNRAPWKFMNFTQQRSLVQKFCDLAAVCYCDTTAQPCEFCKGVRRSA